MADSSSQQQNDADDGEICPAFLLAGASPRAVLRLGRRSAAMRRCASATGPHTAVRAGTGGKKKSGERGMLPVTIRQLIDAHVDEVVKVDGREANQVTFVGQIVEEATTVRLVCASCASPLACVDTRLLVSSPDAGYPAVMCARAWLDWLTTPFVHTQSVSTTFKITDTTGEIEVNSWIDNEETEENVRKRAQWVTGAYVRVVGNCRLKPNSQPPVKSVMAFHIRKIDDFNELTYHLLDSVHAHLFNTQGPKDSLPPAGSNFASPGKPSMGPGSRAPAAGAGAAVAAFSNPAGGAGEPLPQDWRVQGAPSKMGSEVPLAPPRLKLPRGPF